MCATPFHKRMSNIIDTLVHVVANVAGVYVVKILILAVVTTALNTCLYHIQAPVPAYNPCTHKNIVKMRF